MYKIPALNGWKLAYMYEIWFCNIICIYTLRVQWCKTFSMISLAEMSDIAREEKDASLFKKGSELMDTWRWATSERIESMLKSKDFFRRLWFKINGKQGFIWLWRLFSCIILLLDECFTLLNAWSCVTETWYFKKTTLHIIISCSQ